MARLYVANCTHQNKEVWYRVSVAPEGVNVEIKRLQPKFQRLVPGQCLPIGGDLEMPMVEELVKQLNPYGLVGVAEAKHLGHTQRADLVFDLDREVNKDLIRRTYDHNRMVLGAEGEQRRAAAAIAARDAVIANADDTVRVGDLFEVEYEQLDRTEGHDGPMLGDGIRLDMTATERARGA